jgi:hypothetical protein
MRTLTKTGHCLVDVQKSRENGSNTLLLSTRNIALLASCNRTWTQCCFLGIVASCSDCYSCQTWRVIGSLPLHFIGASRRSIWCVDGSWRVKFWYLLLVLDRHCGSDKSRRLAPRPLISSVVISIIFGLVHVFNLNSIYMMQGTFDLLKSVVKPVVFDLISISSMVDLIWKKSLRLNPFLPSTHCETSCKIRKRTTSILNQIRLG